MRSSLCKPGKAIRYTRHRTPVILAVMAYQPRLFASKTAGKAMPFFIAYKILYLSYMKQVTTDKKFKQPCHLLTESSFLQVANLNQEGGIK